MKGGGLFYSCFLQGIQDIRSVKLLICYTTESEVRNEWLYLRVQTNFSILYSPGSSVQQMVPATVRMCLPSISNLGHLLQMCPETCLLVFKRTNNTSYHKFPNVPSTIQKILSKKIDIGYSQKSYSLCVVTGLLLANNWLTV